MYASNDTIASHLCLLCCGMQGRVIDDEDLMTALRGKFEQVLDIRYGYDEKILAFEKCIKEAFANGQEVRSSALSNIVPVSIIVFILLVYSYKTSTVLVQSVEASVVKLRCTRERLDIRITATLSESCSFDLHYISTSLVDSPSRSLSIVYCFVHLLLLSFFSAVRSLTRLLCCAQP